MKIEEFYLSEETAESCIIRVAGKWYYFTAEGIVKYGQVLKINDL